MNPIVLLLVIECRCRTSFIRSEKIKHLDQNELFTVPFSSDPDVAQARDYFQTSASHGRSHCSRFRLEVFKSKWCVIDAATLSVRFETRLTLERSHGRRLKCLVAESRPASLWSAAL